MTSAELGRILEAEGWRHSPDNGRDTWYNVTDDGEIIRVRWRNPVFVTSLSAQPAAEQGLRWEATLFHANEQVVLAAAHAALADDDDPPVISRLDQGWASVPLRDVVGADPLASYSYGTNDGRYLEVRVVADEREQVRPTLYAERGETRLYTEPDCPAGVVAAVVLE